MSGWNQDFQLGTGGLYVIRYAFNWTAQREIISMNVGQAGVQLANATWELFCIEHGVRCDGSRVKSYEDGVEDDAGFEVLFHQLQDRCVPRVISVDFEPSVIDEVRTGAYRKLFHPDHLISGQEDCANNFARGNFSLGRSFLPKVMRNVRKLAEACHSLQGFCFLNSYDGGTGSGFGSCLLEELSAQFGKRSKIQLGIYPSRRMASSTVYPYNAVFHSHTSLAHTDLTVLMDNEALYNVCSLKLGIEKPTFATVNRLIAQLYSSLSVSMRYQNHLSSDLDQLCTNLVPYPRIHYPIAHMAPLLSPSRATKESGSVSDLTRDIFESNNQLVHCKASGGMLMSCVLQFRGLMAPPEVNRAICEIKRRTDIHFVDWCPTGFKVGISSKPAATTPGSPLAPVLRSLTMLSNSTAIGEVWTMLLRKFNSLFRQRAFLHWFVGEGLEEGEFTEAQSNVTILKTDYQEIATPYGELLHGSEENPAAIYKSDYKAERNFKPKQLDSTKPSVSKTSRKKSKTPRGTTPDYSIYSGKPSPHSSRPSSQQYLTESEQEFTNQFPSQTAVHGYMMEKDTTGQTLKYGSNDLESLDKHAEPQASINKHTSKQGSKNDFQTAYSSVDKNGTTTLAAIKHTSSQGALDKQPSTRASVDKHINTKAFVDRPPSARPSIDNQLSTRLSTDRPSNARPSVDNQPITRPSVDRPPSTRPSIDNQLSTRLSTDKPSNARPSVDNQPITRPSVDRPPSTRPSIDNQLSTRLSTDKPSNARPSVDNQPITRPSVDRPPSTRPSIDNQLSTKPSTDRPPSVRPSVDNQPITRLSTDRPSNARPSVDNQLSTKPSTDRPPSARPSVDNQPVTRPSVDRPHSTRPSIDNQLSTRLSTDRPPSVRPSVDNQPITRPSVDRPPSTRPSMDRHSTKPSVDNQLTTKHSIDKHENEQGSLDKLAGVTVVPEKQALAEKLPSTPEITSKASGEFVDDQNAVTNQDKVKSIAKNDPTPEAPMKLTSYDSWEKSNTIKKYSIPEYYDELGLSKLKSLSNESKESPRMESTVFKRELKDHNMPAYMEPQSNLLDALMAGSNDDTSRSTNKTKKRQVAKKASSFSIPDI